MHERNVSVVMAWTIGLFVSVSILDSGRFVPGKNATKTPGPVSQDFDSLVSS